MTSEQANVNLKRHGITTPAMNREVPYLLQMKKKSVINTTMTHGAI
mgnify:CR=1 FL=1